MKIPSDPFERQMFYDDVVRCCMASREDRISFYNRWRLAYLYGKSDEEGSLSNKFRKLYAHVDLVRSFLYAQDTTHFAIHLGASALAEQFERIDKMAQILNDDWHDTDTDLLFGEGLRWSLVYGTMMAKSGWRKIAPTMKLLEPHNFGVYREDIMLIDDQEAMCQYFQMTQSDLNTRLLSHPQRAEIVKNLLLKPKIHSQDEPGTSNIIVSQVNPIVGNVSIDMAAGDKYKPKLSMEMASCHELWIWDDDIDGYRIVTIAEPGIVIYDRPAHDESKAERIFPKGDHPFTPIRPLPVMDYFWGHSEIELLEGLQKKYNEEIARVEKILKKQANPSKSASGFTFDSNEASDAWDTEGGLITSDMPGAKMDVHWPESPQGLIEWRHELDTMFDEVSGLPPSMKGAGTPGVRSEAHAAKMVQVGGSRVKMRALIIEDGLDDIATKYVNLRRMFDPEHYRDKKDQQFSLSQFTEDFVAKVDAHSNSPVFVDDQKDTAERAFKAHAILRDRYLEMIGAPNLPVLKQELHDIIEPGERAAQQGKQQLEELKIAQQAGKGKDGDSSGVVQKVLAALRTARGAS